MDEVDRNANGLHALPRAGLPEQAGTGDLSQNPEVGTRSGVTTRLGHHPPELPGRPSSPAANQALNVPDFALPNVFPGLFHRLLCQSRDPSACWPASPVMMLTQVPYTCRRAAQNPGWGPSATPFHCRNADTLCKADVVD